MAEEELKQPLREILKKIKSDAMKAKMNNDFSDEVKESAKNTQSWITLIQGEYYKITEKITLESGKKTTKPKAFDDLTDEDIRKIVRELLSSAKKMPEDKQDKKYMEFLQSILPQMASKHKIEAWIIHNIDMGAFKNPMQAIGTVMKHFGKLADGNVVKEVLKNWED